jgi:hypothetical protein
VALTASLWPCPLAVAIALIVVVAVSTIGPVYWGDDGFGVLPSVV